MTKPELRRLLGETLDKAFKSTDGVFATNEAFCALQDRLVEVLHGEMLLEDQRRMRGDQ